LEFLGICKMKRGDPAFATAWKKTSGFRDVLIYDYFGIDLDAVWDILKKVS